MENKRTVTDLLKAISKERDALLDEINQKLKEFGEKHDCRAAIRYHVDENGNKGKMYIRCTFDYKNLKSKAEKESLTWE